MTKENVDDKKVRVRIAPSPTGALHVGTARTALFNFLFARKHGGSFILRIEDTDLERSDKKFEEDILQELRWLGIVWDEGPSPLDSGKSEIRNPKSEMQNEKYIGNYGPYRQSERLPIYEKHIKQLLGEKRAYFCFCTQEELETEREALKKQDAVLRYSGKCSKLSADELAKGLKEHSSALVRFVMPEERRQYEDLIRGHVEFDLALFGDIAIAKLTALQPRAYSPLYNFAAVVDDNEMRITHVFRGEDHIANTPKQIVIAEALGFVKPKYGHFPLILGSDRAKLSKRHGTATTVRELREAGYYSQAVVNFLALLGWNPGTEQETFMIKEVIEAFDLSRIQNGGAIWNQEKLDWFNRYYAARVEPPENAVARVTHTFDAKGLGPVFSISGATSSIFSRISPQELETKAQDYSYYGLAPENISPELLRWKDMSDGDIQRSLQYSHDILEKLDVADWKREQLEEVLLKAAEEWAALTAIGASPALQAGRGSGDKGKLLWPLRTALSGMKRSDSPFEIAAAIGKEETLRRLQSAISYKL